MRLCSGIGLRKAGLPIGEVGLLHRSSTVNFLVLKKGNKILAVGASGAYWLKL